MADSQWSFADFRLDPANACLWRGAQAVALTPKVFDVLHYLVTHADRLVTKDALLDAVWPETAVSEGVVRMAIGALRQALGDTARAPRYIATVQGRGYRFVAPVVCSSVRGSPRPYWCATVGYAWTLPTHPDGGAAHPSPCRHPRPNAATSPCCCCDLARLDGTHRTCWTRKSYREVVRVYHQTAPR